LSINDFALFILSGLLLNITPGVDMLYVIGRSSTQGVSAGMAAALGIATGCIVHIVFAAAGLSAILATSAIAFMGLKYAGSRLSDLFGHYPSTETARSTGFR